VANACGLSVLAIDYCGHSVATAVGASFTKPSRVAKKRMKLNLNAEISFGRKKGEEPEEEEEYANFGGNAHTDMHILLEKDIMGMTCVQKGQIVFQRFIRCGSHPSYQLGELAMMVEYFRAMDVGRGSTIVGILSGALAEDWQLATELSDMLGISLGLLDFPYDLRWICCIGAAHTNLEFGIPSLNKPSKAMQEMRSNLWQYGLVLAGGLMLIFSVISLLTARLNWDSELAVLRNEMMTKQMESKQYDGFADNYDNYKAKYDAYSQDWDSIFASLQYNNDSLVLVMDELEQLLPEKSSVTNMQISNTGLNVYFACENKEQAAYLIMALRDMQYADLMAVSSLSGGGAGPATTFGTGRTGEKAPVEGGANISTADRQRLAASLDADMDPYTVGYYLGLGKDTPDCLADLAAVYGVMPENEYEILEDVPVTFQQKSDAFYTMCTSNPFAMREAENMLVEHYKAGGELTQYIPMNDYKGPWQVHRSVEDLEKDLENTLDLIYWNDDYTVEELFPVLERIIKENPEAEKWYIYYLEGELEGENPRPYLDIDTMVDDLADGQFDSGVSAMNTVLTNLLSSDTKTILEEITAEPECSHSLIHVQPVAPTCGEMGNVEYWYCEKCQLVWLDEAMTQPTTADAVKLPASHTALVQVEAKEPSATEDGWHAHWHCTDCGGYWMDAELKFETTLAALTRPAQCTHSMTHFEPVAASCDKAGNVEYWYCETCQRYWLDAEGTKLTTLEETVLAPKHTSVLSVDYKAPTETEAGNYAYWTCLDCGGYWTDADLTIPTEYDDLIIAPNGCAHAIVHVAPVTPSCTTQGNIEYWYCTECQHCWLDEALTQPVAPDNVKLPAAHQNIVHKEAVEPTDTQTGYLEHWYCEDCQSYWLDEALTKPSDLEGVTIPVTGEQKPEEAVMERLSRVLKNYMETGKIQYENPEDEILVGLALQQYMPGKTVEEALDEQLTNYFTYGETGIEQLDQVIAEYLDENPEKEEELRQKYEQEITIQMALKQYLGGRDIGFESGAIKKYLVNGITNDSTYDTDLNASITDGEMDTELTKLLFEHRSDSITNNTLKSMFQNYVEGTGNAVVNERLEYLEKKIIEDAVKLLKAYLTYGSADPRYDEIIEDYLEDGKLADGEEKLFDEYISGGNVDAELTNLVYLYTYKQQNLQGAPEILAMLNNYRHKGGTGSEALDTQIKKCYDELLKAYINELNKQQASGGGDKGSGGGNGNKPQEPADTRIHFAVVLMYNDELRLVELERKGLDYSEKLEDRITALLEEGAE